MKDSAFSRICCGLFMLMLLIRPDFAAAFTGQLNLNTATRQELEQLPTIGKSRARAIVEYRQSHGPFQTLEELTKVGDIGDKSLEAIRPYLTLGPTSPPQGPPDGSTISRLITTRPGDILLLADGRYYPTLIDYINHAEHSIDITMFLFKITPSRGNRPSLLADALIAARKRGVEVRVVLEKSGNDEALNQENRRVAGKLQNGRIQVIFDSPHTTTHAKFVVIDRRYTFLGSHNLSQSALAYNHETSLLIDNSALAFELIAYMDRL